MNKTMEYMKIFGWQGGTVHQVNIVLNTLFKNHSPIDVIFLNDKDHAKLLALTEKMKTHAPQFFERTLKGMH